MIRAIACELSGLRDDDDCSCIRDDYAYGRLVAGMQRAAYRDAVEG